MKEKIENLIDKWTKLHPKAINEEKFFINNYVHIKEEKEILVDFINDRYGEKYREKTRTMWSLACTYTFRVEENIPNLNE